MTDKTTQDFIYRPNSLAELRAYDPTWRDNIASWLMSRGSPSLARENFVAGLMGSTGIGSTGFGLADLTPLGMILGAQEAAKEGNYKLAALNLIPGAAGVKALARSAGNRGAAIADDILGRHGGIARGLADESLLIYNPPTKPQRPFEADYAKAIGKQGSRLEFDIEGRPLVASTVVGRRTRGDADEAITPAELDAAATAILGAPPKSEPQSALHSGAIGEFTVSRGSEGPLLSIQILKSLDPVARHRVLAHETGHLIDHVAGRTIGSDHVGPIRAIPQTGLERELRQIYHDLNDATVRRGKETPRRFQTGPEAFGYEGDEIPPEYMAEAVRAYLADPNYIKTVAPKTAQRLREYVNSHPLLSKILQLNTAIPAASVGVLGYGAATQQRAEP